MVPKVAAKGASFKGAALYYLHDKNAATRERVAFTHTENLFTRDPDKAIKCMAWTALHQSEIKERAGTSTKGRKLENPVYTYSLSWAPGQTPTQEQMIDAGRETLRVLGLQDHEALFVAHNDEPHQHLHVIVNRVHPETGKAAGLSKDHLRLSEWAEEYERRMGKILCEQRVKNNEKRRDREFVKDTGKDRSGEFYRLRRQRLHAANELQKMEKGGLSEDHAKQRRELFAEKENRIRDERQAIKENYAPDWQWLKDRQKMDRRVLRAGQRDAEKEVRVLLKDTPSEYIRMLPTERRQFLAELFKTHSKDAIDLARQHKKQRTRLAGEIKRDTTQAFKRINDRYRTDLAALKERQQGDAKELSGKHFQQARDIREGSPGRRDISEAGKTITTPRDLSLSERFRQAKERAQESQPGQEKPSLSERFKQAKERLEAREQDKTEEFRKEGDELTRPPERKPDKEPGKEAEKDRDSFFRDNKDEITRDGDRGRDRGREIDPPDAKPD